MAPRWLRAGALAAACLAVACAERGAPSARSPAETGARAVLLRYAPDGWPLERAVLERRLEEDFRAADRDGDGAVGYAEAQVVNEARRDRNGVVVGRIVDWNKDGTISLDEFAGAARGAFASVDRDDDGAVSADEVDPGDGEGGDGGEPAGPRRGG